MAVMHKKRGGQPSPAKQQQRQEHHEEPAAAGEGEASAAGYTLKEEKEIIAFAKRLAANEKAARDQALRRLEAWMTKHKHLAEKDLLKIWTGLFYCMWMADKAQVQEDLAVAISRLVHCFKADLARARLFVCTFYRTIRREWPRLDQHRLDKFYAFMRMMLRECLAFAGQRRWSPEALAAVVLPLDAEVLAHPHPNGLRLHLCDLALPELARVGGAEVTTEQALRVLQPFLRAAATCQDKVVAERARARVLLDFIEERCRQRAEEGGDEEEEEAAPYLPQVSAEELQATVFDLAASEQTRDRFRPALYEAHKAFQGLTGKKRADAGTPSHLGLVFAEDAAGAALEKKQQAAAARAQKAEEQEEAAAAKKKKKEARTAAAAAAATKHEQQEEEMPKKRKALEADEPTKKAKKVEPASRNKATEKAAPLETPFGEVEQLSGLSKAQRKKIKKVTKANGAEASNGTPAAASKEDKAARTQVDQGVKRKAASGKQTEDGKATAAATTTIAAAGGDKVTPKPVAKKAKKETSAAAAAAAAKEQQGGAKKAAAAAAPEAAKAPAAATKAKAPAAKEDKPAEYIPSKKFAGGKAGYAFKKGPKGLGYYWDPVQNGGGVAAGGGATKKVRWGKVQVKLFNKNEVRLGGGPRKSSHRGTVSFMGNKGGAGGGKRKMQGGGNRRKAISYF